MRHQNESEKERRNEIYELKEAKKALMKHCKQSVKHTHEMLYVKQHQQNVC